MPLVALDPDASNPEVLRSLMYFPQSKNAQASFGTQAIQNYLDDSMNGRFLKSFKRFLPQQNFDGTLLNGKLVSLEELIARFLREMRDRANAFFKRDVDSVLLGRPARFSEDDQLDKLAQLRLQNAAELAGFKNIQFLEEPVAAAYRFKNELTQEQIVLVADFGGGTSDFTVIKLSSKPFRQEDVLAVGGVPLAGDSFDGALMQHRVAPNFGSEVEYQIPMSKNILRMPKGLSAYLNSTAHINFLKTPENREFLKKVKSWSLNVNDAKHLFQLEILLENQLGFSVFEAIELAKRNLSDHSKTQIEYSYPGIKISESVTQANFRKDAASESAKIFSGLDDTIEKAGLKFSQIDRVCCTGGTAKSLLVREGLLKRFPEEKLEGFRFFSSIVEGLCERAKNL